MILLVILADPASAATCKALLLVPEWSTDGVSQGVMRYLRQIVIIRFHTFKNIVQESLVFPF